MWLSLSDPGSSVGLSALALSLSNLCQRLFSPPLPTRKTCIIERLCSYEGCPVGEPLFFADDSVLFCKFLVEDCCTITDDQWCFGVYVSICLKCCARSSLNFSVLCGGRFGGRRIIYYVAIPRKTAKLPIKDANLFLNEFKRCRVINSSSACSSGRPLMEWTAPPANILKLNVEASVIDNRGFFSVGSVIRDSSGLVVEAFSIRIMGPILYFIAKCHALREGSLFAKAKNWRIVAAESDTGRVMNCVKNKDAGDPWSANC